MAVHQLSTDCPTWVYMPGYAFLREQVKRLPAVVTTLSDGSDRS